MVSDIKYDMFSGAVALSGGNYSITHMGGGFRLGCRLRRYPLFLLGYCFELHDAVLALSADCVHTPLCIRVAVVLFSTNPGHFYCIYLFLFAYDTARHCRSDFNDNMKV